ncbi:hypothetical protein ACIP5Z_02115 [Rothia terrae]|uniref:hypothetical protein n=1 Tax=Rothia terrae TaxID=396015 RepID=UPI0037FE7817
MNPAEFVQTVLSQALDVPVHSQVPLTVPDTFLLHTVTSNRPVANGPVTASMDTTFAISVISSSNVKAFAIAQKVTEVFEDVYEQGKEIDGSGLAYFSAEMLPLKQPNVSAVTEKLSHQYNAQYRLIIA